MNLRSLVILGLFVLSGMVLGMVFFHPQLLQNAAFMGLATLVVGGSGLGAAVAWLFGGTKVGGEVMAANAQALSAPPKDGSS